jgi:hypothetical protein
MITQQALTEVLTATWKTFDYAGDKLDVQPSDDGFYVCLSFKVFADDASDLALSGISIATLTYFADTLKRLLSISVVEDNFQAVEDPDVKIFVDLDDAAVFITQFRVGCVLQPK